MISEDCHVYRFPKLISLIQTKEIILLLSLFEKAFLIVYYLMKLRIIFLSTLVCSNGKLFGLLVLFSNVSIPFHKIGVINRLALKTAVNILYTEGNFELFLIQIN